jgi:hypothetical protein
MVGMVPRRTLGGGSSAVKREQLRAVAVTLAARYLSFQ